MRLMRVEKLHPPGFLKTHLEKGPSSVRVLCSFCDTNFVIVAFISLLSTSLAVYFDFIKKFFIHMIHSI